MLLNFASIVPGGMVVFVPSYRFLHAVTAAWETSGLIEKLQAKKKVRFCIKVSPSIQSLPMYHRSSRSPRRALKWRRSCGSTQQRYMLR